MKKIGRMLKKLLIIYLIIFIAISSMSKCYARPYDADCGEYLSDYARDFIQKYCTPVERTHYDNSTIYPHWSGGSEFQGDFYACCSTGVWYMYKNALGVDIYNFDFAGMCDTARAQMLSSSNWEEITSASDAKPGDIVINDHHTELYIGDNENANFGNSPHSGRIVGGPRYGEFTNIFRPTFAVNPQGSVPVEEEEDLSIYDENGFIYSGVAELKSYEASKPFGKWIFEKLTEILDYIVGIATLGIRMVIVGWTAIVERFFIDGIVNSVTGVTNERVDDWQKDPNSEDEIDRAAAELEAQEEVANETAEATGEEGDENYISEGMQIVSDIGGNVQLKTTSKANVTIENIVYNKIPILDINFFNFESAGGAVVDENGIIYIIKENVALWYYVFRVLAIVIMMLVLIYLGIKMAITTVAEKKAVYKQMLVSWIAGFILVFAINYIMYFVIYLNESFISWVIPKYETGEEISLYESVRSKAYELKASTGFAGMFMYIILVYFSLRFLFVYFKRYFTIMILALISPFVAVSYALQKISKNGRGSGETYGNWVKDFSYTVLLQSMHALIYTIFISTVLKLSETSLLGIFISFIFLHYMVKMDPLLRKIFGFSGGRNAAKLAVEPIAPKVKAAQAVGKKAKKVAGAYGNVIGKVGGKPVRTISQYATKATNTIRDGLSQQITRNMTPEEKKKREEERRKKEQEKKAKQKNKEALIEQLAIGLKAGKDISLGALKGALVVPMFVIEPATGVQILSSTISSAEKVKKTLRAAKEKGYKVQPMKGNFKLKGIYSRNKKSASKLSSRFNALGVRYNLTEGPAPKLKNSGARISTQISNLKLANNISGASIDPSMMAEYEGIMQRAKQQEKEVEMSYKEIVGKMDEQIAEMEKVSPEFAKELQRKKEKELQRITEMLEKPLSEKDVFQAMQNYKSKVPSFNPNADFLSQRDIEGIAKEIDSLLKLKGQDIRMSKEFVNKVQREITENQRRMKEEKERIESRSEASGQDVSGRGRNNITETTKTVTEKVRTLSPDKVRDVTAQGPNAPQQNQASSSDRVSNMVGDRLTVGGTGAEEPKAKGAHDVEKTSSSERLVKNIVNASRGSSSKVSSTVSARSLRFVQQIEKLQQIGEEAKAISGEDMYSLDDILERLKNL